jgi:hypothetical protein
MVSLLCASSICISKNENFIAAAAVTTVYTEEEEDISFLLFLLILVYTFNIDRTT